ALAVAMAVANAGAEWRRGLAGTVTVQVLPVAGEDGPAAVAARTARALDIVRATPGVARAEPLAAERVAQLLEPWLGGGTALSDLPVPSLIDVTLAEGAAFDG